MKGVSKTVVLLRPSFCIGGRIMNYYNVAKIVNTRGLRGELKVIAYTDFPEERFQAGTELQLFKDANATAPMQAVTVQSAKPFKGMWLIQLAGLDSINEVEKFKGMMLKIAEDQLQELGEDEFYQHEIIGLEVVEEGQTLGKVKEILSYGPNDVWVVERPGQKDLLLPYLKDVVLKVDLDKGVVEVAVPEGLD
ncbi:ribosome maturation factor RimM [Pediococcus acidilactici]|nr:ribosome maturation factor RimM [Pediococcus acidilactici]